MNKIIESNCSCAQLILSQSFRDLYLSGDALQYIPMQIIAINELFMLAKFYKLRKYNLFAIPTIQGLTRNPSITSFCFIEFG